MPDFWLVAMKNIEDLAEEISERDEACLSALVDVRKRGNWKAKTKMATKWLVLFADFTSKRMRFLPTLRIQKRYHMEDDSEDAVLNYIVCDDIDWKPGKNLTVKVLRKKPKPGAKNQKPSRKRNRALILLYVFLPAGSPGRGRTRKHDRRRGRGFARANGERLRDRSIATALVPNAVDHFLGLHLEDDEDEDEEEGEEDAEYGESIDGDSDEEDDDDEDDEDDEDENGEKIKGLDPKAKEECKQQ